MAIRRRPQSEQSDATQHGASQLAPSAVDLQPGTPLAGYRVEDVAGRGGMGVVYRATHLHLQRTDALKVLSRELVGTPGFRERFMREARTAASLPARFQALRCRLDNGDGPNGTAFKPLD